MFKLITVGLLAVTLSAGAARAQTQDANASAQERRAQEEQAERERRQAASERKDKERGANKEPGTRCGRWKRGKA